ncbi:hypothetical protein ACLKA6_016249 [Drosophila palustris]
MLLLICCGKPSEAKSDYFVDKLRAIDPNQNRGFALWKCTRGLKRQPMRRFSLLRRDGTWTRSDSDIAEEFANDLCESTRIQHRPEVKYLGIIIDRRLTWKPHILRTCATVRAKCKKLDWLLRPRSGLSLTAKVRLFKAIISPSLTWGVNIWGTACNSSIKKIESCQSKILRRIVGSPCHRAGLPFNRITKSTYGRKGSSDPRGHNGPIHA